jgi:hypothetical protein
MLWRFSGRDVDYETLERRSVEQLNYNLLFRWFVGLSADEPVSARTVFSHNRYRMLALDVAAEFLYAVLNLPELRRPLWVSPAIRPRSRTYLRTGGPTEGPPVDIKALVDRPYRSGGGDDLFIFGCPPRAQWPRGKGVGHSGGITPLDDFRAFGRPPIVYQRVE